LPEDGNDCAALPHPKHVASGITANHFVRIIHIFRILGRTGTFLITVKQIYILDIAPKSSIIGVFVLGGLF
jgi:hypothetical protein